MKVDYCLVVLQSVLITCFGLHSVPCSDIQPQLTAIEEMLIAKSHTVMPVFQQMDDIPSGDQWSILKRMPFFFEYFTVVT